jgi:hypothetical protein
MLTDYKVLTLDIHCHFYFDRKLVLGCEDVAQIMFSSIQRQVGTYYASLTVPGLGSVCMVKRYDKISFKVSCCNCRAKDKLRLLMIAIFLELCCWDIAT